MDNQGQRFLQLLQQDKQVRDKVHEQQALFTSYYEQLSNQRGMEGFAGDMTTDSYLRVVHANYAYILWSLLAVIILVLTIQTLRRR
jgi:hypothetical protein